jgi:hypothetical protein
MTLENTMHGAGCQAENTRKLGTFRNRSGRGRVDRLHRRMGLDGVRRRFVVVRDFIIWVDR